MTIRQNIFRQIFEESVSVKIPPVKILCYTVAIANNQRNKNEKGKWPQVMSSTRHYRSRDHGLCYHLHKSYKSLGKESK